MSRFFSGDPVETGNKSRFFGENVLKQTPDARFYEIDLEKYGNLITDKNNLIFESPQDLDDIAAENQSGLSQVAKSIPRLASSAVLKLGQSVALLGSAAYYGTQEAIARTNPGLASTLGIQENVLSFENVTDNLVVNALFKAEEAIKESKGLKIFKPSDWDEKSIWEQIGSTAWWADEFADGAAFALQAWASGGAVGALGIGSRLASGVGTAARSTRLASVARQAAGLGAKQGTMGGISNGLRNLYSNAARGISNPQTIGRAGDFLSQVGIMTTSEALFEARDTGHTVQQRLLEEAGYDVSGLSPEEQLNFLNSLDPDEREAIKQKKGQAMQNTFLANMAAISFSNIVEVAALNKLMGKGLRRLKGSQSEALLKGQQSAAQGIDIGDNLYAPASAIQRKGIQRYIGKGSRPRELATIAGGQALSEGLYEENIQNSISNISEHFDGEGAIDYIGDVLGDMWDNTFSGDKDAWKSIVTGAMLGGLMGVGAGTRQYKAKEQERQRLINNINAYKANVVNLKGQMLQRDDNGEIILDDNGDVIFDRDALLTLAANQSKMIDVAELHDLYKESGNREIADVLWNDAITELSLSYLEAGFGEDLINQVKSLNQIKEEELQNNGLEETTETTEEGSYDTPSEKIRRMTSLVENVKKDYEDITSIIPNTEENNLRINTAVKITSRLRKLNERRGITERQFNDVNSSLGGDVVTDINTKVDRYNALKREADKIKKQYPKSAENLEKKAQALAKDIEQSKALSRTTLGERGITTSGLSKIQEDSNSPERIRLNRLNEKLVQFESAIETQIEKYDNLITNPEGFQNGIIERINEKQKEADKEKDLVDELSSIRPGDFIELTEQNGNKKIVPVHRASNGSLLIGGQLTTIEDLNQVHSSIRLLSPEERSSFIESEANNFRKGQVVNKISKIQERLTSLKEKQQKEVESLLRYEDSLNSLRVQKLSGKTRLSEKTLNKRIEDTEALIISTQQEIDRIDEVIKESSSRITSLEFAIANDFVETDLDILNQELDLVKEEYAKAEVERVEAVKFLERLKNYYEHLKKYWNKFFPNKRRVFQDFEDAQQGLGLSPIDRSLTEEEQNQAFLEEQQRAIETGEDYSNFQQDLETAKSEIAEREEAVKALEERSNQLQRIIEFREKEIKQYEEFLRRLENPGEFNPVAGQEESPQNLPTINGTYTPEDNEQEFRPKKNISEGLFTTTGNSTVNTPAMQAWFKFTESARGDEMLLPVTIYHPLYGIGGEFDLFSSEPEAFRTIDNIKVVPISSIDRLASGGMRHIELDGQIVNTSLIEITDSKKTFEDFKFRDGELMFHNNDQLTSEQISKIIEDYRRFINEIKSDALKNKDNKTYNPKLIYATGKSWGIIQKDGIKRSASEAFGFTPELKINTTSQVTSLGNRYTVDPGIGYVYYKGRPIPAETRLINNAEADELIKLLKEWSSTTKERRPAIFDRIRSVMFIGKSSNPKFSTYFARGNKDFVFGDSVISIESLQDGTYDTEIKNHILTLNHQIYNKQLKKEEEYTALTGEKYSTYSNYLMSESEHNRQTGQLPITFDIIEPSDSINSKQVDSSYLKFANERKVTYKKKKTQTKIKAEQKESENPITSSYDTMDSLIAQATSNPSPKPAKKTDAEKIALQGAVESNKALQNEQRLLGVSASASVVTLGNGDSYIIDREQKAIFSSVTGELISPELRREVLDLEITSNTSPQQNFTEKEEVTETTPETVSEEDLEAFLGASVEDEFSFESSPFEEIPSSGFEEASFGNSLPEGFEQISKEEIDALKKEIRPGRGKGAFLLESRVSEYRQADIEQETKELERLVGSKALAGIVSGLIQNKAFGLTLQDGSILLSDLMTSGTAYHEAFHRIFEGVISPSDMQDIIEEWKANNSDKNLTDLDVIEELAEEFRLYMLTGSQPDGFLGRVLKRIADFIKAILGIPVSVRDQLFYKIKQGDFRDAIVERAIRPETYMESGSTLLRDSFGTITEREVMEGMTYAFMEKLIKNNFSIDDILNFNSGVLEQEDNNRLKSIYIESLVNVGQQINKVKKGLPDYEAKYKPLVNLLASQFKLGTKSRLFYDFTNHLKRYNISLQEQENNEPLTEDDKGKDTLGLISSIEFNVKSGVPNVIKLALLSLPSLDREGRFNINGLGLPRLSNYKRNLAVLHNRLAGLDSVEEMRDEVVRLSSEFPEFNKFLSRLGLPLSGEVITESTPLETVRVQNQFKQQFDKSLRTYYTQLYDEGNSYFVDANSERTSDLIKQKWQGNFRLLPKENLKLVNGRYIYNSEFFEDFKGTLGDIGPLVDFYKALGIEFTNSRLISDSDINTLQDIGGRLLDLISKTDIDNLFNPDLNITGWMNQVVEIEAKQAPDISDNQFINAEGKTIYGVTLNTYLDLVIRKLNKAVPEFLKWDSETNSGSVTGRNSLFLSKKFKLKLVVLEGANVVEGESQNSGQGTHKLNRSDSSIQQFTSVMKGIFPFIRQSDRKTEYAIQIQSPSGGDAGLTALGITRIQDVVDIFRGYLSDELLMSWQLKNQGKGQDLLVFKDQVQDLRLFKDVFNNRLKKDYEAIINSDVSQAQAIKSIESFVKRDAVGVAITNYLNSKVEQNLNEFVENGTLDLIDSSYVNNGLPLEIVGEQASFTKEEILPYLETFTFAYMIGNVEQMKLFTGDSGFYKLNRGIHDFFKRTGGLGGTGKTLRNDQEFNNWLNINMSRPDRNINGKIDTWVFNDVVVKSSLYPSYVSYLESAGYSKTEAESLLSPYDGYDEADAQGYITLPEYREMLFRAGDWNSSQELAYQKLIAGEQLSASDLLTFPPLKPQYFGPQEYEGLYVPTFYKLSLMPLIPGVMPEGSVWEKLNNDMLSNGVGIATFSSANKVGKKEGQPLYNSEGGYNTEEKVNQILDYDYMKIQLDMSPEKHFRATFGTQFRKLVLTNLIGKNLYGSKKGEDYIKQYSGLIEEQIQLELTSLFNRLNIKFEGDSVSIDRKKLSEFLTEEAHKRASTINALDDIREVIATGRNAEIMITRGRLESLLLSLINNNAIHNKVFGDMYVQASSTGYEGKNRTKLQQSVQNEPWASDLDKLGFYEYDKNGTIAMEVYVPHKFRELYGRDIEIGSIDPRLLELIGFRIPTQGLNSIEVIKIKDFLPQSAGNTVIVPSEIVAKAGSDFDIDKLTIFLPNYNVLKDRASERRDIIAQIPEMGEMSYFGKRWIDSIEDLENLEESGVIDSEEQRIFNLYKDFVRENGDKYFKGIEYIEYPAKEDSGVALKKKAVQNEIIRLSREIVSAPENFKDLITPISTALLKEESRNMIRLKPSLIEERTRGNYVDMDYIMSVREDFLTGKDGVGIAAANLTHHVLSQVAELKISPEQSWINLDYNRDGDSISLSKVHSYGQEGVTGTTISDILSAFVNGFVDIGNDPFLRTINASVDTAGTYMYLIRAGVPLKQAVLFMNQPIISSYLKNKKLNSSMAKKSRGDDKSRKEIEEITRFEFATSDAFNMSDTIDREEYLKMMKTSGLEKAIQGKMDKIPFNRMQNQVLTDFLEYERVSGKLRDLQQVTNSDTKGTGPTLFSASDLLDRYNLIKEEGFFENVDKFETETIIGTFNNVIRDAVKAYSPLFPILQSPEVRQAIDEIVRLVKLNESISQTKVERVARLAENDFISYLYQNATSSNGGKIGNLIKSYFHGENSLPKRIARLKESNDPIRKNLLIEELYPILSSSNTATAKRGDFDNLKFFSRRIIKEHADDLTNAWEELFNSHNNLANQLFTFSVLQSSFNNSHLEYLKYAPTRYTSGILDRLINKDSMNQGLNFNDFVDVFLRNNWMNSDLVPYQRPPRKLGDTITARKGYSNRPFVKTSTVINDVKVYLLYENTGETNVKGFPIFKRTDSKGNGMFFKEYLQGPSVIVENRAVNRSQGLKDTTGIRTGNLASEIRNMILQSSDLTQEEKQFYLEKLRSVQTEGDLVQIQKQICN